MSGTFRHQIDEAVRKAKERNGWNQAELAKALGYDPNAFSNAISKTGHLRIGFDRLQNLVGLAGFTEEEEAELFCAWLEHRAAQSKGSDIWGARWLIRQVAREISKGSGEGSGPITRAITKRSKG